MKNIMFSLIIIVSLAGCSHFNNVPQDDFVNPHFAGTWESLSVGNTYIEVTPHKLTPKGYNDEDPFICNKFIENNVDYAILSCTYDDSISKASSNSYVKLEILPSNDSFYKKYWLLLVSDYTISGGAGENEAPKCLKHGKGHDTSCKHTRSKETFAREKELDSKQSPSSFI